MVNTFAAHCGLKRIAPPPGCIAIDPHVHSLYSSCCISPIEDLIIRAAKMGLSAVAIMDHNDLRSVKHAVDCAEDLKRRRLIPEDFVLIPGTEVSCGGAHHIGALFVNEPIPEGLGVKGTLERIHEAGGLAIAVHPYLRSGIGDELFDAPFDAVEIESGSIFRQTAVERGYALLTDERLRNVAKLGSSDAHYIRTVGLCCTLIKTSEVTPAAIRSAIVEGRCEPHSTDACLRLRKLLGSFLQPEDRASH